MDGSAPRISLALLLLRSEQALSAPMRVITAMHSGSPAQFVSSPVLPFYSRRDLSALACSCPFQSLSRQPGKLKVRQDGNAGPAEIDKRSSKPPFDPQALAHLDTHGSD